MKALGVNQYNKLKHCIKRNYSKITRKYKKVKGKGTKAVTVSKIP
jgi:hypothetical protein